MIRRTILRPAFGLALAIALGGCTVLNLDGFDLPRCGDGTNQAVESARCANALNELNGFPPEESCHPYECIDGFCVLSQDERCDASDNDCDGLVDEGLVSLFVDQEEAAREAFRTEHPGMDLTSVSVAPGVSTVRVTYTDTEDDAWSFPLVEGALAADFIYKHNVAPGDPPKPWISNGETLINGCWTRSFPGAGAGTGGAPEFSPTNCSFARIATDRVQGFGLGAAINTRAGCIDGQLRVGHTSSEEPDAFQVNGPYGRSNSFLGVGLTSDGRCTSTEPATCRAAIEQVQIDDVCAPECAAGQECFGGTCVATPDACTDDAACDPGRCLCGRCVSPASYERARICGVSGVAMAATKPSALGVTRGVVAFTGGSNAFACNAFERDVALLGTSLVPSMGATTLDYVTATNEGEPQVLGQTRATSAPAVYGLDDQFVVVYPTPDSDGLALHVVNELPPVTVEQDGFTTATCLDIVGEEATCPAEPTAVCAETDCGNDHGVCVSGEVICLQGEGICDGHVEGGDEICGNDLDDDCDGVTDEDPASTPCIADCVVATEVCNARDDDCDGSVDEDTGGDACGGGSSNVAPAACVEGTEVCRGGKLLCMGSIDPAQNAMGNGIEYCGSVAATVEFPYGVGVDDDCDGTVDESCAIMDCTGNDTAEFCNGRDDDEDCLIDEDSARIQSGDIIDTPSSERPESVVRQCMAEPAFPEIPATVVEGGLGWGSMDDITIAGTTFARGDEIAIGVAWTETSESNPDARRIGFRILRFQTDCTCTMPGDVECSDPMCSESSIGAIEFVGATDPVEVTLVPRAYGPPHVAYQPDGIVVAGSTRDGRTVERDGGFVVIYTQPETTGDTVFRNAARVRSFAEHDGRARNPGCGEGFRACSLEDTMCRQQCEADPNCETECAINVTILANAGEGRSVPNVSFPRVFYDPQEQQTRFLYYDGANREFVSYEGACSDR